MSPMSPLCSNQKGFALIEVLVGLAVLSIALMAGMRAIAQGADTQLAISQRTMALWSADNLLMGLRMNRAWPEMGTTTVSCPQATYIFVCQRKVLDTPNPGFRRVEVTVYLASPGSADIASGPRLAWLTTVIPNPTGRVM
ncbi:MULTISPECIES: type II secretion system minor pseudopilin GspI [unclassified Polynucleobacter]|uniref:type II secretion system minor pseudopilin GspI n=1 Tax=unclassified Polynucleobacter TaxID=2640945 RepID=UPI000BC84AD5|nr:MULTISPECIES: type II secretion system minor pseudopilin GspI [unclassified Polynucleobacter]OYY19330.1 MAG: type II secretion system protein GspI [Polynucleobacter sp. 35-46-11]OZA77968.1 MAG: type II secretion system protein GspI [Polynucleobacter sp. 39-46-10]